MRCPAAQAPSAAHWLGNLRAEKQAGKQPKAERRPGHTQDQRCNRATRDRSTIASISNNHPQSDQKGVGEQQDPEWKRDTADDRNPQHDAPHAVPGLATYFSLRGAAIGLIHEPSSPLRRSPAPAPGWPGHATQPGRFHRAGVTARRMQPQERGRDRPRSRARASRAMVPALHFEQL